MDVTVTPPNPADLAIGADVAELVAPAYGSHSLAELVPAITARLTGDEHVAAPSRLAPVLEQLTDRVVVLVVDGLGSRQLARARGVAPLIESAPGIDGDAVFPTTTVASISSIGTGRPPSQHGLVGYTFRIEGHTQPLSGLSWHIGLRGGGFDARTEVVPEALQPEPTAFEQAAAAGVATTVIVDPAFPDSGLTRASLRGGERRTARGYEQTLATAVEAATARDAPSLTYCHLPFVDWAGHVHGPCSPEWLDAVAATDRTLAATAATMPADVSIVVTSDHGMVLAEEPDVVELEERDDLMEGVEVLAGEPRLRQLGLAADADPEEVVQRWSVALGDRALVLHRRQALHLFGPAPTRRAISHIGDVVVVMRRGTVVHARVDPHGGRHPGQHGGPSAAERLVPMRVVRAATAGAASG